MDKEQKVNENRGNISSNLDYVKFMTLDETGLRKFSEEKKKILYKTLKYSILGTIAGGIFANLVADIFKSKNRDTAKMLIVLSSFVAFTYYGYCSSHYEFRLVQRSITQMHGKEI